MVYSTVLENSYRFTWAQPQALSNTWPEEQPPATPLPYLYSITNRNRHAARLQYYGLS